VEVSNLLNQHSATFIDQNLIRTSYVSPAGCGTAGTNCSATMDAAAGFDYGVLMTKGFDYIAQGNTNGKILNSRYGQAFGWQDRRTVRFSLQVTF
jgi:hypothetical protein